MYAAWRLTAAVLPGVFFIPANTPIAVEASDRGLELWLAGVNSQVFAKGALAAYEHPVTQWNTSLAACSRTSQQS